MKKTKMKRGYVPYDRTSSEHIDWNKAEHVVFPNLKPSSTAISLRLPDFMLNRLKVLANKRNVPYQSLLKVLLDQALARELRHAT